MKFKKFSGYSTKSDGQYYFKGIFSRIYKIKQWLHLLIHKIDMRKVLIRLSQSCILAGILLSIIMLLIIYFLKIKIDEGYTYNCAILISIGLLIYPSLNIEKKQKLLMKICLYPIVFLVSIIKILEYIMALLSSKPAGIFLHLMGAIAMVVFSWIFIKTINLMKNVISRIFSNINGRNLKSLPIIEFLLALFSTTISILPIFLNAIH